VTLIIPPSPGGASDTQFRALAKAAAKAKQTLLTQAGTACRTDPRIAAPGLAATPFHSPPASCTTQGVGTSTGSSTKAAS
jgi:hypothetical protein